MKVLRIETVKEPAKEDVDPENDAPVKEEDPVKDIRSSKRVALLDASTTKIIGPSWVVESSRKARVLIPSLMRSMILSFIVDAREFMCSECGRCLLRASVRGMIDGVVLAVA
jgi:hypothetical protein